MNMHFKKELRVVGFDDGPFVHGRDESVLVVGVVLRMNEYLDGVVSTYVTVDGLDATDKLIECVKGSKHFEQIRVIFLDGLAFGGFNVVDIVRLSSCTGIGVIAVTTNKPNRDDFISAASKLHRGDERVEIIERTGEVRVCRVNGKNVYFQCAGIDFGDTLVLIRKTAYRSALPESVRMAHIIATGVVDGDSRGRA